MLNHALFSMPPIENFGLPISPLTRREQMRHFYGWLLSGGSPRRIRSRSTLKNSRPLIDPKADARISPVVIADFIQLSPNRWVSVQRRSSRVYAITVSGVLPSSGQIANGDSAATRPFSMVLYSRWYAT